MPKKKNTKPQDLRKLPENNQKKPLSRESRKLLLYTVINTVVLMSVYFYFVNSGYSIVMFIYMGLTAAIAAAFVIYNKGFYKKNITEDMLSDDMTPAEKRAFIEEGKERLHKSRWMITLLLPLILTFFADWIMIVIVPYFKNLF